MRTWQYAIAMRHPESDANLVMRGRSGDLLYYPVTAASDLAVGYSQIGRFQLQRLCQKFAEMFPRREPLANIHFSPFFRTRTAAVTIARSLPYFANLIADRRLSKRSAGRFWRITYRGVEFLFPREYDLFKRLGGIRYRPPGGENLPEVHARMASFSESIGQLDGNQLAVMHKINVLVLRKIILGLRDEEVYELYESEDSVPNASFDIYARPHRFERWHLIGNDTVAA